MSSWFELVRKPVGLVLSFVNIEKLCCGKQTSSMTCIKQTLSGLDVGVMSISNSFAPLARVHLSVRSFLSTDLLSSSNFTKQLDASSIIFATSTIISRISNCVSEDVIISI